MTETARRKHVIALKMSETKIMERVKDFVSTTRKTSGKWIVYWWEIFQADKPARYMVFGEGDNLKRGYDDLMGRLFDCSLGHDIVDISSPVMLGTRPDDTIMRAIVHITIGGDAAETSNITPEIVNEFAKLGSKRGRGEKHIAQ